LFIILGRAHFTNGDTFENMNFTPAKIVACSSLKATENNIILYNIDD